MEAQEVFDRVAAHLLTQGRRSVRGDEAKCAYRGEDGLMCAVGCLIPDDVYRPTMENWSAHYVIQDSPRLTHLAPLALLLDDLQDAHDAYDPESWPDRLRELAERYGLTFNAPGVAPATAG